MVAKSVNAGLPQFPHARHLRGWRAYAVPDPTPRALIISCSLFEEGILKNANASWRLVRIRQDDVCQAHWACKLMLNKCHQLLSTFGDIFFPFYIWGNGGSERLRSHTQEVAVPGPELGPIRLPSVASVHCPSDPIPFHHDSRRNHRKLESQPLCGGEKGLLPLYPCSRPHWAPL